MKIDWRWLRAIFAPTKGAATEQPNSADGPESGNSDRSQQGEAPPPARASEEEAPANSVTAGAGKPPSEPRRPASLEAWETLAERRIREAQERGDFDNLPGAGKPLKLDDNPFAGEWELGFHLLKQAGYTLPWIELGREIESDRASLKVMLGRAADHLREMRQDARNPTERRRYEAERGRYRDLYLKAAAELDRKLALYSAEVPTWRMDQGRLPAHVAAQRFDEVCPPITNAG